LKVVLLSSTLSRVLIDIAPDIPQEELLTHMGFTFAIEGVSRACSHQIVRHRVASFSQQSQRYIQIKRLVDHVVTPPLLTDINRGIYGEYIQTASKAYQNLVDGGVAKEDARFVLPNAAETSLLMTMDGVSLMHFFGLRLCTRAQWEVRALANEMLLKVRACEPELFKDAGPYCVQLLKCPEGRFSCGRMIEMMEKFSYQKP
jgi:thymidylate synthase (FAD)